MDEHEHVPATARTLRAVLRDGAVSRREAVGLVSRVADQVADLHATGRAHGALGPDTVLVADDGTVTLTGGAPGRGRPAAPVQTRLADVHDVGRLLALAIGDPGSPEEDLPASVEDLVRRAQVTDAPASAMAAAVRRLEREPGSVARLLPAPAPVPANATATTDGLLAALIPRTERRITGAAAVVVGGATAIGLALLLGGAPASSTSAPPRATGALAAGAAAPAAEPPALGLGGSAAAADDHVSALDVLGSRPRPTLAAIRPAAVPVVPVPPDVSVSAPEA